MPSSPNRGAVLDACCLINLYASGQMEGILRASGVTHLLPTCAVEEVVYVLEDDPDSSGTLVRKPADLSAVMGAGIVTLCEPDDDKEATLFVRLASQLDDGEACALALALARRRELATDDRKAIRIAGNLGASVVTTPALVKRWSDLGSPSRRKLRAVIAGIEKYGRFVPSAGSPLASWWHSNNGE